MEISKNNTYKNRWAILMVVVLMSFMSCLDASIVNISLPVMAKKLSVSMASIEWVIVSYLMIICATLLVFGRLGDIISKSKVFKCGMLIFSIASLMCGLSNSLILLIIFRIIQGIGASAYMANNQGIITQIFNQNERGKSLGILAAAVALGTMIGPPLGGIITSDLSWNYIFLINVPIGIISFIIAIRILPNGKNSNEKFDIKGAILFFITIIFLFGSLIGEQDIGYSNTIIILFIISILCIILFIKLEIKSNYPLLQLNIFKNGLFSLSLFCAFISYICLNASLIIIPFYLQDTLKISPSFSGFFMIIQPLIVAIISPVSGILSDKIGAEILTIIGLVFMSISFFFMSFLNQYSLLIYIAIYISILAIGQGIFQAPNNSLIMSSVPKNKLGISGSVNSLVRNLGQIVGVTLATSLLYNFMSDKIGYRVTDYVRNRDDVFIYGMKYVYIVLVIVCGIGTILTIFRLCRNKFNDKV